jgi:hypothetical protein
MIGGAPSSASVSTMGSASPSGASRAAVADISSGVVAAFTAPAVPVAAFNAVTISGSTAAATVPDASAAAARTASVAAGFFSLPDARPRVPAVLVRLELIAVCCRLCGFLLERAGALDSGAFAASTGDRKIGLRGSGDALPFRGSASLRPTEITRVLAALLCLREDARRFDDDAMPASSPSKLAWQFLSPFAGEKRNQEFWEKR